MPSTLMNSLVPHKDCAQSPSISVFAEKKNQVATVSIHTISLTNHSPSPPFSYLEVSVCLLKMCILEIELSNMVKRT